MWKTVRPWMPGEPPGAGRQDDLARVIGAWADPPEYLRATIHLLIDRADG